MFELDCRTGQPESMRGITRYQFSSKIFFFFFFFFFFLFVPTLQHAPAPSKAFEDFSDDDVISTNSVSSETDSMSLDTESLLADRAPMPSTGVDTQVLMNRHRAKLSATSPLRSSRHVTESLGMRTNSRYSSDVRRPSTRPSVGQASIQTHAVTESQPSEGVLSSLQNINTSISTLISDMQGKGHSAVPSTSFVPAIDAAASRTLPTHALQHRGTMTSEDILSYQSPAIRSLDNVIKERSVKDGKSGTYEFCMRFTTY